MVNGLNESLDTFVVGAARGVQAQRLQQGWGIRSHLLVVVLRVLFELDYLGSGGHPLGIRHIPEVSAPGERNKKTDDG